MYYQYGYFKPLVVRKVKGVMTLRQLVPPLFVLCLVAGGLLAPWSPVVARALASLARGFRRRYRFLLGDGGPEARLAGGPRLVAGVSRPCT